MQIFLKNKESTKSTNHGKYIEYIILESLLASNNAFFTSLKCCIIYFSRFAFKKISQPHCSNGLPLWLHFKAKQTKHNVTQTIQQTNVFDGGSKPNQG